VPPPPQKKKYKIKARSQNPCFVFETGSCYVAQADFKLEIFLPQLAKVPETTNAHHCSCLWLDFFHKQFYWDLADIQSLPIFFYLLYWSYIVTFEKFLQYIKYIILEFTLHHSPLPHPPLHIFKVHNLICFNICTHPWSHHRGASIKVRNIYITLFSFQLAGCPALSQDSFRSLYSSGSSWFGVSCEEIQWWASAFWDQGSVNRWNATLEPLGGGVA
jgi:hypothetical protein